MNLTHTLVGFIEGTHFDDLPKAVLDPTKKLFVDTIGVGLGGSGSAGIEPTVKLMRRWGDLGESSVWVYGDRMPSINAALVNAAMAHALDFDDTHGRTAVHAGASIIPTALAVAESIGEVNGKDLITAVVLGVEVASKLGLSLLEPDKGWHLSATCGTFACAAVAGKLLGLDSQKMRHALAIAFTQTAGSLQSVIDGALTKRMQLGFCARSGILAALLAREEITGPEHFLEGPYGFFKLYQSDRYDPQGLTKNLGSPFEITQVATKPYPCCRLAHSPLDAMFELLRESDLHLDDIEAIDVYGSQAMKTLCGKPFRVGIDSEIDAQFSLAYVMVSAINRKRVDIDNLSREATRNPVLGPHTPKVNVLVDPNSTNRWFARVVVKKKDGEILSKSVESPKGQPDNPMSWEECIQKFERCSSVTVKPLNPEHLKQFIQTIKDLENTDSVQAFVHLLT